MTPPEPQSATGLAAHGLTLALGGRVVVDAVSLALAPGEIVGVLGPNGAGKSTLLRALAGLVVPLAGTITLDGELLAAIDRRALGRAIAYLPQERVVHWPLAVRAVVALGRLPHRSPFAGETAADRQAVEAALAAMDLGPLAARPALSLSGGERARVLIARALAQEARVVIADEPTAGLDPAHQLTLFRQLERLATEGRSIVVALHDLSMAARYCNRVLVLAGGRTVALGPPGAALSEATLATAFGIRARLAQLDGMPIVLPVEPVT